MSSHVRKLIALTCLAAALSCQSCFKKPADDITGDPIDKPDTTPPGRVTDLRIIDSTYNSLTLAWTAVGDDDTVGRASGYDIRYGTSAIDSAAFLAATQFEFIGPLLAAGETQTSVVSPLESGTKYYFAIKAKDDSLNWSPVSNCPSATSRFDPIVEFPDSNLEKAIRRRVGKPQGELRESDALSIEFLEARAAGIADFTGIEQCRRLNKLWLQSNRISDLAPLARLLGLNELDASQNQITDLAPISGLPNLNTLILAHNQITSIAPLANLPQLSTLVLYNDPVSDFTPLRSLTKLRVLDCSNSNFADTATLAYLTELISLNLNVCKLRSIGTLRQLRKLEEIGLAVNQIEDIGSLALLPNLRSILLDANRITDLFPLVTNPAVDSGVDVAVRNNPLSETARNLQIPALIARGVIVHF